VNDPSFIEQLYSQSPKQRRERYWTFLQTLSLPGSILATKDHDLHRKRRAVLNPFFSQQNVRRLEPVINDTLVTLLNRMDVWAERGEPVQMNAPFKAATKDVIQGYAFGEGQKFLEMEDCRAGFFEVLSAGPITHLGTYFLWLATLMTMIPPTIMTALIPQVGIFVTYVKVNQTHAGKFLPGSMADRNPGTDGTN
jgi:cytochrome P450